MAGLSSGIGVSIPGVPRSFTFANRPATGAYLYETIKITDVGTNGTWWEWNGTLWAPVNGIYAHYKLPAAVTTDGTSNAQIVAYCAFPAGLLATGDEFDVDLACTKSSTSDTITQVLRFGTAHTTGDAATNWSTAALTTTAVIARGIHRFKVISDTSIQLISVNNSAGTATTTAIAAAFTVSSLAANTNYLSVQLQRTSGSSETGSLTGFLVRVYK